MRKEHLSNDLRIRVANYLEYLHKQENEMQKEREGRVIAKLSKNL